jgi:hypothetical protein
MPGALYPPCQKPIFPKSEADEVCLSVSSLIAIRLIGVHFDGHFRKPNVKLQRREAARELRPATMPGLASAAGVC